MKLGLGTVQFGLDYGITPHSGTVPFDIAEAILNEAKINGIQFIDTAYSYGNSETIIGDITHGDPYFAITTKVPSLENLNTDINKYLTECLKRLNCHKIYGMLLHNANDLWTPKGLTCFKKLLEHQDHGLIDKIGISIYPEDDIWRLINSFPIQIIQLPLNILDQRLWKNGFIDACLNKNIEIHVRSVFLQGLLLMEVNSIPAYFNPILDRLRYFHRQCDSVGLSPTAAALSFIRSYIPADVALVGVHSIEQFRKTVVDWNIIENRQCPCDVNFMACEEPKILNPSMWKF